MIYFLCEVLGPATPKRQIRSIYNGNFERDICKAQGLNTLMNIHMNFVPRSVARPVTTRCSTTFVLYLFKVSIEVKGFTKRNTNVCLLTFLRGWVVVWEETECQAVELRSRALSKPCCSPPLDSSALSSRHVQSITFR